VEFHREKGGARLGDILGAALGRKGGDAETKEEKPKKAKKKKADDSGSAA
jgi:hypothetical protein